MKFSKIKTFFKNLSRTKLIVGSVTIIIILFIALGGGETAMTEALVIRGSVEQEVLATGKVKPAESVNLAFERSGRVVSTRVSVGSEVKVGETLVVIDQGETSASLQKAEASLSEALIALDQVKRTAPSSFNTAYSNAVVALTDAYTESADAVYNVADKFFRNVDSGSPSFQASYISNGSVYTFNSEYTKSALASNSRSTVSIPLKEWSASLTKMKAGNMDLVSAFAKAEDNIEMIKVLLANVSSAISSINSSDQDDTAILAGFKADVLAAQSRVNASLTSLVTAKDKYISAPRETLGTTSNFDSILLAEAKVKAMQADVASYRAQLAKTVITSPINGVVTKQDAKTGEIVTAGTPVVSVISNKNLEIEANISEVNISKVSNDNPVRVTFDASPETSLLARIAYIDPGESTEDGVVNYKVRVEFVDLVPEWIKTGLTANLRIGTMTKENVLKIPAYAVERVGDEAFVEVLNGSEVERRAVKTGLMGKDGFIEVVSGLNEGETVITSK